MRRAYVSVLTKDFGEFKTKIDEYSRAQEDFLLIKDKIDVFECLTINDCILIPGRYLRSSCVVKFVEAN